MYLALIVLGVVVFLGVSALLARVWSAEGAERSAITDLVRAEARGDRKAAAGLLQGCRERPSCRTLVTHEVAALTRPGKVSILQLQTSTGFSFTGTTGTARVAWKVPTSLPIVQCVRVRRAGNVLSGLRIQLLAISPRVKSDSACPATF